MKYIAIIDDELLSNFEIDVGYPPHSDMIMVAKDKNMYSRGIRLKPLAKNLLVTTNGDSVYLNEEHIEVMKEMEKRKIMDDAIAKFMIEVVNGTKR